MYGSVRGAAGNGGPYRDRSSYSAEFTREFTRAGGIATKQQHLFA